jgi:GNAT superfamily N-acetyltransferase
MHVTVRNTTKADFEAVQAVQQSTYASLGCWTRAELENHLRVFPQGQFVAELDGRIVGTASTLIILWDDYGPDHDWTEVTGGGDFRTHNPDGFTLYGAEVAVDPAVRRKGVGQALYKARRDLCKALNLKRIIAGGRLPNYHRYADQMSPHLYAMKVIWGDLYDPVLRFQLRQGFQFCQIIQQYFRGDTASLEYAALICWLNPDYNPRRPSGLRAISQHRQPAAAEAQEA